MTFSSYEKIEKCAYCSESAVYLFVRKGFFGYNWRLFCEDCKQSHSRVRDDVRANYL